MVFTFVCVESDSFTANEKNPKQKEQHIIYDVSQFPLLTQLP